MMLPADFPQATIAREQLGYYFGENKRITKRRIEAFYNDDSISFDARSAHLRRSNPVCDNLVTAIEPVISKTMHGD